MRTLTPFVNVDLICRLRVTVKNHCAQQRESRDLRTSTRENTARDITGLLGHDDTIDTAFFFPRHMKSALLYGTWC